MSKTMSDIQIMFLHFMIRDMGKEIKELKEVLREHMKEFDAHKEPIKNERNR